MIVVVDEFAALRTENRVFHFISLKVEREMGVGPTWSSMARKCITAMLLAHISFVNDLRWRRIELPLCLLGKQMPHH